MWFLQVIRKHIQEKKSKYDFITFLSKPPKPQFWAIFGPTRPFGILLLKWGLATFLTIQLSNFMQKTDELFLRSCVANGQTNKWTDKLMSRTKFIGYLCKHKEIVSGNQYWRIKYQQTISLCKWWPLYLKGYLELQITLKTRSLNVVWKPHKNQLDIFTQPTLLFKQLFNP